VSFLFRLPLRLVVPVALALTMLAASSLIWHFDVVSADRAIEAEGLRSIRDRTTFLQRLLERDLAQGDVEAAQRDVSMTALDREVRAVVLLDDEGRVLAATRLADRGLSTGGVWRTLGASERVWLSATLTAAGRVTADVVELASDRQSVLALYPVAFAAASGAPRLGALFVRYSLAEAKNSARLGSGRDALLHVSAIWCLAFVLWLYLHLVVTERLGRLVHAAQRFAAGDSSARAALSGTDELAAFARSFDDMVQQRTAAEARERQARETWERTFDAIEDVVIVVDVNCRIELANLAAARVLGIARERVIGEPCHELFLGGRVPCAACPVAAAREGRRAPPAELEFPLLERIMTVTASLIDDSSGSPPRGVVCFRDVTEKRRLEQHLAAAQKMEAIGTLAGGIAHDFNNLLTPILGYVELLRHDAPDGSRAAEDVLAIEQAALRARDLVRQILAVGRPLNVARAPIDVALPAAQALKLLRASIPSNIVMRHSLDVGLGAVLAAPSEIHQIVMNLGSNAYHAVREQGGEIEVTITECAGAAVTAEHGRPRAESYLRLRVADTGSGMSSDVQARIFEPFFTTKAHGEGTGLGLAVVYGIVHSLDGHISVESAPRCGCTVSVFLPIVEGEAAPESVAPGAPAPRGCERILVVDDERSIAALEQRWLTDLGYRVESHVSSKAALAAFRAASDFDLVLTDMSMPEMTGVELARAVLDVAPGLPIVLCTGLSDVIDPERARAAGLSACLAKPMTRHALATAVRRVLDEAAARRAGQPQVHPSS